jgi:hypothetical protein
MTMNSIFNKPLQTIFLILFFLNIISCGGESKVAADGGSEQSIENIKGEPKVVAECGSVNGLGDISCEFRNVGSAEGGTCVTVSLIPNLPIEYFRHESAWIVKDEVGGKKYATAISDVCSGLVRPQDIRQINKKITFAGLVGQSTLRPFELCKVKKFSVSQSDYSYIDSWSEACSLIVVETPRDI